MIAEQPGVIRMHGMLRHSLVNGPGIRCILFLQGCTHHCPGCQNPETHDIHGGTPCSTQAILNDILTDRNLDGVTLSGGDPLLQPKACTEIAKACKQHGLSVWVYTGYLFEDIYIIDALKKAYRLGFATWGGIVLISIVMGFIAAILQGVTMIPWYIGTIVKYIFAMTDAGGGATVGSL